MEAHLMTKQPIVAIVGPTASGKTALAIEVAKRYGGEVISADSRAIYRGLSIGTAKPTPEEQRGIPHWGIDLADPGERFTAADFQRYANLKIAEIQARGHLPIIVGGTGLYVDAVLYQFEFSAGVNDTQRRDEFMTKSLDELYVYCNKNNIILPENKKNKRYVVNSILRKDRHLRRKRNLNDNTIVVGIATKKEELRRRIQQRAHDIVQAGVIGEAIEAGRTYGWENEALTGNVYPLVREYLEKQITKNQLEDKLATRDWQLAKRQLTWLKRNEHIYWSDRIGAYTYIARQLDRLNNL